MSYIIGFCIKTCKPLGRIKRNVLYEGFFITTCEPLGRINEMHYVRDSVLKLSNFVYIVV